MSAGTTYNYFVSAENIVGGEGDKSAPLKVWPIREPDSTDAPTRVSGGKESITVEWNPPAFDGGATITQCQLYVKADYDQSYSLIFKGIELSFKFSKR